MKAIKKILFAISALLICSSTVVAYGQGQGDEDALPILRPVYSAYMIDAGAARLADTYLTPLTYDGTHYEFNYQRSQAMRLSPQKWIMRLEMSIAGDVTHNPAQNSDLTSLSVKAQWGMMRRWQLPHNLQVGIGPSASLNLGVMYLARNGNNPASAKASFTVNASAFASWKSRMWRLPFTLGYQATLPVTGAFFSPNYGQLYYQIYLGDGKGLAHGAWWGNYFKYDNLAYVDLHFGATTLRLGYQGRITSTKVNHLVTHEYSHSAVVGVCTEWISLRPGKDNVAARLISVY